MQCIDLEWKFSNSCIYKKDASKGRNFITGHGFQEHFFSILKMRICLTDQKYKLTAHLQWNKTSHKIEGHDL